jgi:HEAT repeats
MKIIFFITCVSLIIQSATAAIPQNNEDTFETQYKIAKQSSLPMSVRWKALLSAAEVANGDQFPKLLTFAKDKDWYMRNALLVALEKIDSDLVYDKAKDLLSDKALVVRSAAIEILSKTNDREIRQLFSKEMSKNYNFNGKSSLWVRAQMMKYLVEKPDEGEMGYFVQLIHDKDPKVAQLSMQALEKLTQVRFVDQPKETALAQWKKYIEKNKL